MVVEMVMVLELECKMRCGYGYGFYRSNGNVFGIVLTVHVKYNLVAVYMDMDMVNSWF